jgi:hypothetical protein
MRHPHSSADPGLPHHHASREQPQTMRAVVQDRYGPLTRNHIVDHIGV